MTDAPSDPDHATPSHPEEFRATWDMRMGRSISLQGTARCTPAGVVTVGIAVSAILLAVGVIIREARRS